MKQLLVVGALWPFLSLAGLAGIIYDQPAGGWTYTYDGQLTSATAFPGGPALDGRWSNANGTDTWDGLGRGVGVGQPGGVQSSQGYLTVDDSVNSDAGFEPSNRRIYFTHDLAQDGVGSNTILNDGVTLSFRMRLNPATEATGGLDGYGIFGGGKGNLSLRQAGASGPGEGIISFSLVRQSEDIDPSNTIDFDGPGLVLNRLTTDFPNPNVDVDGDPFEGSMNLLPLDPSEWHEFWLKIQENDATPGNGTHTVTIYMDGDPTPHVFNVTSGVGDEGPDLANYLGLGAPTTGVFGAFDVDFISYKAGLSDPVLAPEPSIWALLGAGVAGLFGFGARKRR